METSSFFAHFYLLTVLPLSIF